MQPSRIDELLNELTRLARLIEAGKGDERRYARIEVIEQELKEYRK